MVCPILGPKCSLYYMLISVWGVLMLALMGIFFKIRSVALFEDVNIDEEEWKKANYSSSFTQEAYDENAINCWIAAGAYCLLFIFSFIQQRMNNRQTYEMS